MMIRMKPPGAISTIPILPTNMNSGFPGHLKISCARGNSYSDEVLAVELSLRIAQTADREEALKKSRQMLFLEVCDFAGMRSEELRKIWRRMSDEERCAFAKVFVAEWSGRWHPLSARSVKEMIDEHLRHNSSLGFLTRNYLPAW